MKRKDGGCKKKYQTVRERASSFRRFWNRRRLELQHPRKLLLAAARKKRRLFHRVTTLQTYTESLQRGEAVLRVRSHGKQCRAGGDIKSGLLQEKHLSDGTVSVLLVSGGEVFCFFFDRSLWSQAPLFSTGWKKSDEKGGWKNINDQHDTLWETLSVGTKCVPSPTYWWLFPLFIS